jgi:hypothetical protein|tara:strand:- start:493 stop:702 length:210 start_codon:yes stop_codon:yes gene_type:complete
MFIGLFLIAGLFVTDNAEFFKKVDANVKDGMTWSYVGPQRPDTTTPYIPLVNQTTGEETIIFKMAKDID